MQSYFKQSKLLSAISAGRADGSLPRFMDKLVKTELLIIDDLGLSVLTADEGRNFLDIIDDRLNKGSTIMASQLPIDDWYKAIADPTIADAIQDRLVHKSHKLNLRGDSMRKS